MRTENLSEDDRIEGWQGLESAEEEIRGLVACCMVFVPRFSMSSS